MQGAVAKCEEEDEGAEHGQDLESICVVEDSFIKTEPTEIYENSECIETEAAKEVNHKVTNLVNCFNKSYCFPRPTIHDIGVLIF